MPPRIAIILPPREGFAETQSGAVALCVKDFTRASSFNASTRIFGGQPSAPQQGLDYRDLKPGRWWRSLRADYARRVLAELKDWQPDLVEVQNRPLLARWLARRWKGNVVLHLHNDPRDMRGSRSEGERRELLEGLAGVFAVSQWVAGRFREGLAADGFVHIVPNGLDAAAGDVARVQEILFVGRLKPEKGALPLAQALARLLPRHPGWRARFLGAERHAAGLAPGTYEQQVLAALEPVATQVDFSGFCPHAEVMQAFHKAAIAVVPSQWQEPFGRAALEAMASGCPLVTSLGGGLREVVGDAALGLEACDAPALEAALEALMLDAGRRNALSRQGIERAALFSLERSTEALDAARHAILG